MHFLLEICTFGAILEGVEVFRLQNLVQKSCLVFQRLHFCWRKHAKNSDFLKVMLEKVKKYAFSKKFFKKNSRNAWFFEKLCKTNLFSGLSATTLPKTVYGYLQNWMSCLPKPNDTFFWWSHPISKTLRAQKRKSASNFYKRS